MKKRIDLDGIPAILWGEPSEKLYLFVHGKLSGKEAAEPFSLLAAEKGYQTLSFDLAQHGERTDGARLDVFSGIHDLNAAADYAFSRWQHVSLYACSIGAYFSLQTYGDRPFEKALFQSPIVDMGYLVGMMMQWFHVTPEELKEKGEIDTPVDPLRWDYYQYIQAHPVEKWPIATAILYGGKDELQSRQVLEAFCQRFQCKLTVSPDSEHPFMGEGDTLGVSWLIESGSVDLSIAMAGEEPIYQAKNRGNGDAAAFELTIPKSGDYTITVTGRKAKGWINIAAARQ